MYAPVTAFARQVRLLLPWASGRSARTGAIGQRRGGNVARLSAIGSPIRGDAACQHEQHTRPSFRSTTAILPALSTGWGVVLWGEVTD